MGERWVNGKGKRKEGKIMNNEKIIYIEKLLLYYIIYL
jgi:hypothetical protein